MVIPALLLLILLLLVLLLLFKFTYQLIICRRPIVWVPRQLVAHMENFGHPVFQLVVVRYRCSLLYQKQINEMK